MIGAILPITCASTASGGFTASEISSMVLTDAKTSAFYCFVDSLWMTRQLIQCESAIHNCPLLFV